MLKDILEVSMVINIGFMGIEEWDIIGMNIIGLDIRKQYIVVKQV
jgi:hypothetical protein